MFAQTKTIAAKEGIKIEHVYISVRKEAFVSEILTARGDAPEIVCILAPWRVATASNFSVRPCYRSCSIVYLIGH